MSARDQESLLRWYRILVACFPAPFRREQTDELLGVLLDTAAPGQHRPTASEAVDLVRGAMRMRARMRTAHAPTARAITRLLLLGALLESAASIVVWRSRHSVLAAVRVHSSGGTGGVVTTYSSGFAVVQAAAVVAIGMWITLAWAYPRHRNITAALLATFTLVSLVNLLLALTSGTPYLEQLWPDLLVGTALVMLEFTALGWMTIAGRRTPQRRRFTAASG